MERKLGHPALLFGQMYSSSLESERRDVGDIQEESFSTKLFFFLLLLKALCAALLAVRLAQESRSPFGYSEDIIAQTCMFTLIIWHNCELKTVSASRALQFGIY